jgi:hypothetical protein
LLLKDGPRRQRRRAVDARAPVNVPEFQHLLAVAPRLDSTFNDTIGLRNEANSADIFTLDFHNHIARVDIERRLGGTLHQRNLL